MKPDSPSKRQILGNKRLLKARAFIAENYSASFSLSDVSKKLNISPFHLQRSYKQLFQETPLDHRNRLRLARAKTLLRTGKLSVTEVCLEIGFESPSSFSGWFCQHVGLSPSQFQKYARQRNAPHELEGIFIPSCFLRLGKSNDETSKGKPQD